MIVIYTTYPNKHEAKRISKTLLEGRLVACANILPSHESLYWWDGDIQNENEVAVIYKSRPESFTAVKDKIVELHSYQTPCVVSWDIEQGHEAFLQWIGDEVSS